MHSTRLSEVLHIDFPVIIAPMHAISNEKMAAEALKKQIAVCLPMQNWKDIASFKESIINLQKINHNAVGVQLFTLKENHLLSDQIKICLELSVSFIVTAMGKPDEVIKACSGSNTKVFASVKSLEQAQKAEQSGANALIAINSKAAGIAGEQEAAKLLPILKETIKIPIISAGGIGNGKNVYEHLNQYTADACMIGSIFIASEESDANLYYKKACVLYKEKDIVIVTSFYNHSLTLMKTPFLKKVGFNENWIERILLNISFLQKKIGGYLFKNALNYLKKSAQKNTHKTVWIASGSIKNTLAIKPTAVIIDDLISDYNKVEDEQKRMSRSVSRES